ncbi:MAG TPA: MBL fold metallo-hydrolase [Erythrobacter sp.]|nr:MBL fold metallo-hydrolase [Erythrobacter sp.]
MNRPQVSSFFDEATNNVSHVVSDPETGDCAIIDPLLDYDQNSGRTGTGPADKIIAYVRGNDLKVAWIIETHIHADHISAAPYLKEKLGGKTAVGEHITQVQSIFSKIFNTEADFRLDGSQFDHLFRDEEKYRVGKIEAQAIHTPGHTPACMTHLIGDAAFVGDTLFMPDYGTARCDFPGGDAGTLYRSIQRIFALPQETRIFLNHDYLPADRKEYRWETSVAEEKRENVHVHEGVSEDDFVAMRDERDRALAVPRLMIPSVQVNMRAGEMPPPEENGVRYIKIPVDTL